MAFSLDLWKLDHSQLYPIGLANYKTETKDVVVVWTEHSVQSLLFIENGFSTHVYYNIPPKKKFKVQPIPKRIIDLLLGTAETIIITEDGTVKRFASNKRVIPVNYINGVRCACVTREGFAMICISPNPEDKRIIMQTFPASLANSTSASQTFDLRCLEGLCQTTWSDSMFVIKEIIFSKPYRYFWKSLRIATTKTFESFIFFSIDNVLFVLVAGDGNEYTAHTVETCSSNIVNFWQSQDEEAIYVLLESGTMVVLFPNTELACVRLRSYLYFDSHIVVGHVFKDVFVYSNGVEVIQASICKTEFSYTTLHGSTTEVYGVTALIYLPPEKKILAITENRKFFSIAYSPFRRHIDRFQENRVYVNNALLVQAKTEIVDLIELNQAHEHVQAKLSSEKKYMRAVAAVQKALPLTLNVSLTRYMPKIDGLLVQNWEDQKNSNGLQNYFVHIQITPKNMPLEDGVESLGFASHDWQLAIQGSHIDTRFVRVFRNNFTEPVHLVYLLHFGSFNVPTFHIFIRNVNYHNISISYPVNVQPICAHDLMTVHKEEPETGRPNINGREDKTLVMYQLRIPADVSLMDIKSLFETDETEFDASANCIYIFVLDYDVVQLIIDDEHILTFRSDSSDAMFCVKQYILLRLLKKLHHPVRTHRKQVLEEMKVGFHLKIVSQILIIQSKYTFSFSMC